MVELSNKETPNSQADASPCKGKAKDPIIPDPIWNKHLFWKEFFVSPSYCHLIQLFIQSEETFDLMVYILPLHPRKEGSG